MHKRTTLQKINIFKTFFTGLLEVYGTYDPKTGQPRQIKEPVTDKVIYDHLMGKQPYGVYLLNKDKIRAIAVDFDNNNRLAPFQYQETTKHYEIEAYIERSKSKGYHVWIFFDEPGVLAYKARMIIRYFLEEIEQPNTEFFPKHDQLRTSVKYGNYINAPLFGGLVPKERTVFIDPTTFKPYLNQWDFLESIKRHNEKDLDDIIEINEISTQDTSKIINQTNKPSNKSHTLPICAQKMLQDGVTQYQRVSCFRLAIHLKRIGLPLDLAVAALKVWAQKNKPTNGKGVIIEPEIVSQATCAYNKHYSGYGCQIPAIMPFCEQECLVRQVWIGKANSNKVGLKKN
ncbi:MAG: hypothetical protein HF978_06320 [Desulfobacteraceae bacterium]|nr:hypothetical protein [Desulfobacteraceae bacterium]MBC2755145.1 hypothetical protein [Desulfobacteraceae bacterium]